MKSGSDLQIPFWDADVDLLWSQNHVNLKKLNVVLHYPLKPFKMRVKTIHVHVLKKWLSNNAH